MQNHVLTRFNFSNIIDSNFGNFLLNRLPLVLIELRLWHVWCDMFLIFLGKWHSSTNGNKLDIILTCYRKYLTKGNIFELWSISDILKSYLSNWLWLSNTPIYYLQHPALADDNESTKTENTTSNLSSKMSNLQDVERFEHQVEDMYSILVNISSELVNIKVRS